MELNVYSCNTIIINLINRQRSTWLARILYSNYTQKNCHLMFFCVVSVSRLSFNL